MQICQPIRTYVCKVVSNAIMNRLIARDCCGILLIVVQGKWRKIEQIRWEDTQSAILEVHLRRLDDALSIRRSALVTT